MPQSASDGEDEKSEDGSEHADAYSDQETQVELTDADEMCVGVVARFRYRFAGMRELPRWEKTGAWCSDW